MPVRKHLVPAYATTPKITGCLYAVVPNPVVVSLWHMNYHIEHP